ncbi:FAD-binding oxidoreductase [Streptomyces sp. H27-C3]|uniref:FAD-binding oxidoreductase n=1 Tax=Streptomyces sp. H27-C3 TaxID=3046305 RepID=UPI0024B8A8B4|nr:FAD-binding oxidoreductase [Streptomyces sp. H27-C3]MDJ0464458.1 FAD-binding oxidoreductase [Streptomyces sp. H27-C3]
MNRRSDVAGPVAESIGGKAITTVLPGDDRYQELTVGHNTRWVGTPDSVKVVHTTGQVVQAVQEAVNANKRVAVRGGGHCYADFVFNSAVKTVIDMTQLDEVSYDPFTKSFVVEAGSTLLHAYQALYKGWGVSLPAGLCYSVGIGGHISGGGFGLLSRQYGVTVDHLYAVEVVTVDRQGRARCVMATREKRDPNRELWWAHTGGGGGNFGVVTRYFFRSPDATGSVPADQLMTPPKDVYLSAVALPWADFDKEKFTALVTRYGDWHERNSTVESRSHGLTSLLVMNTRADGVIGVITQLDASVPGAQQLIEDYLGEITSAAGVTAQPLTQSVGEQGPLPAFFTPRKLPWLTSVRMLGTNNPELTNPTLRSANKSAYHRKGFTAAQAGVLYKHLTRPDFTNTVANIMLFGYGSKVNTVPEETTACAQRSSIFKALYATQWSTPADDAKNTAWLREVYGEVYSATGGYPVPNASTDGCYVNYPDIDITDPAQNTSGVRWSTLYYKNHYARLQQIKKAYDPRNVFRHSQSVELP